MDKINRSFEKKFWKIRLWLVWWSCFCRNSWRPSLDPPVVPRGSWYYVLSLLERNVPWCSCSFTTNCIRRVIGWLILIQQLLPSKTSATSIWVACVIISFTWVRGVLAFWELAMRLLMSYRPYLLCVSSCYCRFSLVLSVVTFSLLRYMEYTLLCRIEILSIRENWLQLHCNIALNAA